MNKHTSKNIVSRLADIDIRLIRVFKAVVDCAGFTAAEQILNKSKSAISIDISDLETRLGMTLCHRGPSGFSVTDQGKVVYAATLDLLHELNVFKERVGAARDNPSGTLSVFVADNIVLDHNAKLEQIFTLFSNRAPNAFLDIRGGYFELITQSVMEGRSDVGITTQSVDQTHVDIRLLYQEDLFLYCGITHPLFNYPEENISCEELYNYRFIKNSVIHDPRLVTLLEPTHVAAKADQLDVRAPLILTGNYIGFLPPHVADYWVSRQQMRALLPEHMHCQNPFYFVKGKGVSSNPLISLFEEIVAEVYKLPVPVIP